MSCCGSQRRQLQGIRPSYPPTSPMPNETFVAPRERRFVVCFEYIGQTSLTVIGGVSGRRYRFERPGIRIIVDPHDRPSLAAVPNLRQV